LEARLRLDEEDRLLLLIGLEKYYESLTLPISTSIKQSQMHKRVSRLAERIIDPRTGPKFGEESFFQNPKSYFETGRKMVAGPFFRLGYSIGRNIPPSA